MERENLVTLPPRMKKDTFKRDRSKYCDYNKDNHHDTEECIHLKENIEELIRQGHLKNFIQKKEQSGKKFEKKDYHGQW